MSRQIHPGRTALLERDHTGTASAGQSPLLFPLFLEDRREYWQAEEWWRRRFRELTLAEADLYFQRFYPQRRTRTSRRYDGNPIFQAYFPILHKGVRIIQELPVEGEPLLSAWLDRWPPAEAAEALPYPEPFDPALNWAPVPELVIRLSLGAETVGQVLSLLQAWIVENVEVEEMQGMVEEVEYGEIGSN